MARPSRDMGEKRRLIKGWNNQAWPQQLLRVPAASRRPNMWSSRRQSARTDTIAFPRWRSVVPRRNCFRASQCFKPSSSSSSPIFSHWEGVKVSDIPNRRALRAIHSRWLRRLPGAASPTGSRGHSRPKEASAAASKPAPFPGSRRLLVVRTDCCMPAQIHRQNVLAAIGDVAYRINGEVTIMAPAEKDPQRHAGPGLALPPGVLIQPAEFGTPGPGTLRHRSSRTRPTLAYAHIGCAEKRSPTPGSGRGLVFSLGLVANWLCPGKLSNGHAWKDYARQKKKPTALGSCGLHWFRISNTPDIILYGVTPTSLSSRLKRHVENSAIGTETRQREWLALSTDPQADTN
jgi:hypothetical protein